MKKHLEQLKRELIDTKQEAWHYQSHLSDLRGSLRGLIEQSRLFGSSNDGSSVSGINSNGVSMQTPASINVVEVSELEKLLLERADDSLLHSRCVCIFIHSSTSLFIRKIGQVKLILGQALGTLNRIINCQLLSGTIDWLSRNEWQTCGRFPSQRWISYVLRQTSTALWGDLPENHSSVDFLTYGY